MVLSLAPSVFAAEDDPGMSITFSNTTPDPGDTVTALITVDADADFSTALGYGVDLWYDPEWLTVEKVEVLGTKASTRVVGKCVTIEEPNDNEDETIADNYIRNLSGEFARVTFKVSEYAGRMTLACKLDVYAWDSDYEYAVDSTKNYSLSVQGTASPTATGYTVSMATDRTFAVGETVSIPVTVASSEKKITGFNAYDMTFTYDPDALTLNTASDAAANLTVEDGGGTVRVRRYGETAPLGEALTLDFTAKKGAASTVTLTGAKFDLDANSINFDAPAATIADADTKVTGLWNVTLPDGFRSTSGVDTVEDGGDFTFTAPDAHYDYTLNVTTNGKTDQVTMKGNKSYTIENVTDNVTVAEVSRTAKTYTLKFVVDDRSVEYLQREPLTLADLGITDETVEVQYPNNYEFTVKFPGTGRYFGATISPDKNRFVKPLGDVSENGDCTYTLDGSKLTGDENGEITITINVYAWQNKLTIGVGGNGAEDFAKDNALTCYPTENYTFTVNKSEYYDYTVTATYWQKKLSGYWDTVRLTVRDNGDGTYTIVRMPEITEHYELANVDVTITITKTAKAVDPNAVAAYEYVQLDGKTVVLVKLIWLILWLKMVILVVAPQSRLLIRAE